MFAAQARRDRDPEEDESHEDAAEPPPPLLERAGRGGEVLTLRQAERNMRETDRRRRLREFGIDKPVVRPTPKVGPNEPCPCGSGKKYNKCCGAA